MNIKLSAHFSLHEFIFSRLAQEKNIDNTPNQTQIEKLFYLSTYILEPIRQYSGAIIITSGFRSPQLNSILGGSKTSQHLLGEAADFIPKEKKLDSIFSWIVRESGIKFGQVIYEDKKGKKWIHISLPRLMGKNQEALMFLGNQYLPYT